MCKKLFIWVEGSDDKRFFEKVVRRLIDHKYDCVKVIPYSQMTKNKMKAWFRSISCMGADYIYVADRDDFPCVSSRKQSIRNKTAELDDSQKQRIIDYWIKDLQYGDEEWVRNWVNAKY